MIDTDTDPLRSPPAGGSAQVPPPPPPPPAAESPAAAAGTLQAASSSVVGFTDPVEGFLGRPFRWVRPNEDSVPSSMKGLAELGGSGQWKAVGALSQKLLATSHPVDELLWLRCGASLPALPSPGVPPPSTRATPAGGTASWRS